MSAPPEPERAPSPPPAHGRVDQRTERDARQLFESKLMPGETLVWSGRPGLVGLVAYAVRYKSAAAFLPVGVLVILLWHALLPADDRVLASPGGQVAVAGTVVLILALSAIAGFAWAGWVSSSTVYAVTNQRILVVAPDTLGGTTWISRRELKRMAVRPFHMLVFEREFLPVEKVLLAEPQYGQQDADYVRSQIRNRVVFAGIPDPRGVITLVERTFGIAGTQTAPRVQ